MMLRAAGIATVAAVALLAAVPSDASHGEQGQWLAGDLHVHTIWGHDTCITPLERWDEMSQDPSDPGTAPCDEPWTWSLTPSQRIQEATLKGLDFMAISDHNNVLSQRDPGYTAHLAGCPPGAPGCLQLIPAYENSLGGHVQMLGATTCHDSLGPTTALTGCNKLVTQTVSGIEGLASGLRGIGGAFQINHPGDRDWETNFEARFDARVVPDSMEVWNIGPWFYQPPFPAANDNDHALAYWDSFLAQGHRVAATGGSDSHWTILDPVQGVGEPTTWVWATGRTPQAILDAIRAGRTGLSFQPPSRSGVRLFLEADGDGDGLYEAMIGDDVAPGSSFRASVEPPLPGAVLRIVHAGGWFEVPITTESAEFSSDPSTGLPVSGYVRAELRVPDALAARVQHCPFSGSASTTYCRNRLALQALTSPIYIR